MSDMFEQLLDEYQRYKDASPSLSDRARLVLAERILRQMQEVRDA